MQYQKVDDSSSSSGVEKFQKMPFNLFQFDFIVLVLHYILLVVFINLFANLEIMMRVVSTHPVYYWVYIYLMAKSALSKYEKILKYVLIGHHAVFLVIELTMYPMGMGQP